MDRREAEIFVQRRLDVRRRLRAIRTLVLVSLGVLLLWRIWRGPVDDYSTLDRKRVAVAEVLDGETFVIEDRPRTHVRLLGVAAPEGPSGHFFPESRAYLRGRLSGRAVLLKLDGTQTRDDAGRLLAYVYLTDTDLLNADIIRDGRAFADRRRRHTLGPQLEQLESEARKKRRGLWEQIDDASIAPQHRMPAWRRQWLDSLDVR